MPSEEEKIDLACLQAIQDMGGYVTLESWIYSLYLRDAVPAYDDFFESYCRLRKSKLMRESFLALNDNSYCLTIRGKTSLRKKEVQYKESKRVKKYPLREMTFEVAKEDALEKLNNTTNEVLKRQKEAAVFGVLLWLLSLILLTGGILFACLYQGSFGWRFGIGIAGVILYAIIGTVDALACAPKCSYKMQIVISEMCFPAYGLLILILEGLQGI